MQKGIGIICVASGVLLLAWGHNLAQSVGGQLQHVFTGSPGDKAMHLYLGGTALGLSGLFLIFWKK
jgi:hypothetical protein